MHTQEIHFYSDGYKLAGSFFRPDNGNGSSPQPLVIPCSGFTGLCRIHPARFARYLTARGHHCFGFDYRGFAQSEGPRGRVLLEEQVRDITAALAYVRSDPQVDERRVILLGWGMGGSLVLDAARAAHGVIAVAAVNGFYNGLRFEQAHRDEAEMREFLDRVETERAERARTGRARFVDPFEIYPLDPVSREYVDNVLRKTPGYQGQSYSLELADSLLRWNVEAYAPHMHTPLLILHGAENQLHPPEEPRSLHDAYGGPKELHWVRDAGHTEFMHDDDPRFQAMAARLEQWIQQRLEACEWTLTTP